jgi:glycosyltransferase involved in cell wall biosynthesis
LKFSIITPVYNGEEFLEETLKSVLEFAPKGDYEHIVINDGSTDSTDLILEKFGSRIMLIEQKQTGQSSAINSGLQIAKGELCLIVNCDDPLVSSRLFEVSSRLFEEFPEIVCVYPNWEIIDQNGISISKIEVEEFSVDELFGNFNCLVGPGGVFKTSIGKQLKGWNSSFKFVPDYDFWLRMSGLGDFKKIPETLACWRTHGKSISVQGRGFLMAAERIRVIKDNLNSRVLTTKQRRRAISAAYYSAAVLSAFDPLVSGRKFLIVAIGFNPLLIFKKKPWHLAFLLTTPISSLILKLIKEKSSKFYSN